jgi:hypothetical protein
LRNNEILPVCIFPNFSIGTVGLSDGNAGSGYSSTNSYAIAHHNYRYWLSGMPYQLEDPIRAIEGDVVGCGLLLNSKNELAVFFTVNGILRGKLIVTHN